MISQPIQLDRFEGWKTCCFVLSRFVGVYFLASVYSVNDIQIPNACFLDSYSRGWSAMRGWLDGP